MTMTAVLEPGIARDPGVMRATVFHGPGDIRVEEVPRPRAGAGEAVIRVTLDDDLRHRPPHRQGRVPGPPGPRHRPRAGRRHRGARRRRHRLRDRRPRARRRDHAVRPVPRLPVRQPDAVRSRRRLRGASAAGASATPSTARRPSTCSSRRAQANLAQIPDDVTDEQVVLLADIASTGFSGAESGGVRIGDAVVVFAQGPIGLCATAGAQADGRVARHRRRQRPGPARDGAADGRRRRARLHRRSTSSPRSSG